MNANQNGSSAKSEPMMVFRFSEKKQEMQTTFHKEEPWVVAVDACEILKLSNVTRALESLDDDEKLTLPLVRAGQIREVNCVNESGLYNLIFKSRKPEAKAFRKWVTSEVLPAIRKRGYYFAQQAQDDFIDARDVPYQEKEVNGFNVRYIVLDEEVWASVNDVNKSIHSSTSANQVAKKLNAKQQLAKKIWLFGNTHPAWFTNELGLKLLLSGSRKLRNANQIKLAL